jgi:sugar phosphate permease
MSVSGPTSGDVVAERVQLSRQATKRVFRRLVPFLLLMYVIAFLDRSNVSFAQDEWQANAGISAASYSFGAGLFFAGYAIFEVPSNLLLHRVGARWWLARIMVSWGIVSSLFMFVSGPTSFYILRFLLGVTEAGFFPGVILYLTYWVPARDLNRARGYFYMGIALAGILGNPLSGGLLELDGVAGLHGTQWMFLVEGILAIAVGIWSYFFLTDRPRHADWLPEDQREALATVVEQEDTAKSSGHGPTRVLRALGNWRVWYFAAIYFCIQIAVYGMTFFLPTQVTAITGQKLGFAAALVTAIPWLFGLISVAFFPGLADRTRRHRTIGTTLLLVSALGIAISGALSGSPVLAIGGLALAAIGFVAVQPIFWALPTEYMTGYAAAAGIGLINSLGNLGGFLAPVMRSRFDDTVGGNAGLYSLAAGAAAAAVLMAITALFPKANTIETGEAETLRAARQARRNAAQERTR